MVPLFLIPSEWLAAVQALPRLMALWVLLPCATMLVLGRRYYRYYLCLGFFMGGWAAGAALGRLMHVNTWYVAIPVAVLAAPIPWTENGAKWILPVAIGFLGACTIGSLGTYGLKVANFWFGFVLGGTAGVAATFFFKRFTVTLAFAVVGAAGVIASLGAVVGAREGLFAPGGYWSYPIVSLVTGVVLVVASVVAQVLVDPGSEPTSEPED